MADLLQEMVMVDLPHDQETEVLLPSEDLHLEEVEEGLVHHPEVLDHLNLAPGVVECLIMW